MNRLKIKYKKYNLYKAGLPNYPRNFTRDSIISAILMNDPYMLKEQLSFCAIMQGKKKNPYTGEEPGKIIHEYPCIKKQKLSTRYNACDTTALFLIGHEFYQKLTKDYRFSKFYRENIKKAVEYIISHLVDYAFLEDPKFCNAEKFASKVTYWKDSEILNRKNGQPIYPVVYTLAHAQNIAALRSASKLLKSNKLKYIALKMNQYMQKNLFDENLGTFYIALDKKGPIKAVSSDSLHTLFYLNKKDIKPSRIKSIVKASSVLETPAGYRALEPNKTKKVKDWYHVETLWPFEQAIIHIGAKKFRLFSVKEISSRVLKYLNTDPEMFILKNKEIKKGGCDPQLWTIAAKKYFQGNLNQFFQ
jgi:glycogen debranching enzyme